MNAEELNAYFGTATLPEKLRLDRACTQHDVAGRVTQLLQMMQTDPDHWRSKHQLLRIKNALENPYNGPEIPAF